MAAHIQPLLRAALAQRAAEDPDGQLDVVITPGDEADAEKVTSHVQSLGCEAPLNLDGDLHCRMQPAAIRELAESDAVSNIRLARIHTMHST